MLVSPRITRFAEDAVNVSLGSNVAFSVDAVGHFLEFAWRKQDGQSSLNTSRFVGVATSKLTIRDVRFSDAGTYECEVSNSAGRARTSASLEIGELKSDWKF